MKQHKSNLLSEGVRKVVANALAKQAQQNKTDSTYLSDSAWHVVRCGGGIDGVGCGKRFSLVDAKFRGIYLVCPHCEFEN